VGLIGGGRRVTERAGGLGPYVPKVASTWDSHAPGELWRAIKGTLVFVDISGFTKLSERLAQRGRIGAEELTAVLDRVFGRMLEIVFERGGSLLKFGGDALLLLFDTEDHLMQASAAAVEMRTALRSASEEKTSVGRINLKMSAGIHTGSVDFFLVGDSHRELIVTGPTASMTTMMESTADAGEIVVSSAVRQGLPADFVGLRKGEGWLLAKRRINLPGGRQDYGKRDLNSDLAEFVPLALRNHLAANIGDSEHRIATVGFVKFKGVDALLKGGSPQRAEEELHSLVTTIQAAVDNEGVTFLASDIDADGGKIIITTGVPSSQHDDEGRMLRAAREILDADLRLKVQIGVNRGHVFCGNVGTHFRRTYTVMGDTVNLAARLMAAARPGELYATPSLLNFSSTLFRTHALEPFHVKGKSQPIQAFTVGEEVGVRPPVLNSDLPFRGRDAELQMLVGVVNTCSRVGSGGIMTITGETGVGKSRLIAEVLEQCSGMDTLMIQSEPSGIDNPYWAFRDPVRRLFGIRRSAQKSMARQLSESVVRAAPALEWALPLFGDVVHIEIEDNEVTSAIDSRFRPDRTADALIELLSAVHTRPIAIIAEDGQWLDEASSGLLSRLGRAAVDRPWTVLVTARTGDGYFEAMGDEVVLNPLSDDSIREIAVEATQATPLRPHELDAIVAKTDGNPLFLGEILRMVSETGSAHELPDSLDAVVSEEIDTLPPFPRQLLRYSSVLGRRFRRAVLEEFLAPEGVRLDEATEREVHRFMAEDDEGRFTFRHSVVHDIAYGSLSYSKRRELHARAGDVIERQAGDDPESAAEYLSTHYSQSGEYAKAWRYSQIAADRAKRAYANTEAAAHFMRALDAARNLPDVAPSEVADLWTRMGEVRELSGQLEAARDAYSRALKQDRSDPKRVVELNLLRAGVWMSAGDLSQAKRFVTLGRRHLASEGAQKLTKLMARLDAFESSVYVLQRNPQRALALATSVIDRASELGDRDEALARAYQVLDWANFALGRDQPRRSPEAIEIYQSLGQLERSVGIMNNLGAYAYWAGNWDTASEWYRESIEAAERSGNVAEAALAQANLAEVLIGQRRYEEALPLVDLAERTFRSSNAPFYLPFVELLRARLLLKTDALLALDKLRTLLTAQLDGSRTSWTAETGVTLADALNEAGMSEDALNLLQTLESDLAEDMAVLEASAWRVRGEALAIQGDSKAALEALDRALSVATEGGDPYQEMMIREARIVVGRRVGKSTDPTDMSLLNELSTRLGVVEQRASQRGPAISR
jgi:class 3 adenylate cyclase/predicted ATPase